MKKVLGFIGCGNMGAAMVGGIIASGIVTNDNIIASTKTKQSAEALERKFGIKTTLDNKKIASEADIIFLAVKPFMYDAVIEEIRDIISTDTIIVTIAAGIELEKVKSTFKREVKLIKTMPNTPALVGEAMSAICPSNNISEEELDYVISIFNSFGKTEILDEKDFHGFIALCGSSPAYVFMFIEAMADAAVKMGIQRKKAYKLAAQSVLGSAKMVLDTEKHPGELKDMVCSPRGTTIEAVIELENGGMRSSIIKAMEKCEEKSKNM
ncbi:pyrroline-5-carboxylate reductase [Clostridium zeae]|uniref:Pyrroline-5-carboxylate reductase n=1 Tax=Clostridium zeae TaxID=2759022 RepID=A0ABQ1EFB8_9CLOT|nr:pyrroline-5-carboxylate reductase [Clostridium zeae]GFZ33358.1 pyrroline-5-carboxylate reductase [Clostridium zeae]